MMIDRKRFATLIKSDRLYDQLRQILNAFHGLETLLMSFERFRHFWGIPSSDHVLWTLKMQTDRQKWPEINLSKEYFRKLLRTR